jgi:hypothetical protein
MFIESRLHFHVSDCHTLSTGIMMLLRAQSRHHLGLGKAIEFEELTAVDDYTGNNNALATNYALVRRLGGGHESVNAQHLDVTHLVDGSNICLLALGAPRILRLYKRRCMDSTEYSEHFLTAGTVVVLGPATLVDGIRSHCHTLHTLAPRNATF